jgi:DNA-binding IclR family transcriptional regulator
LQSKVGAAAAAAESNVAAAMNVRIPASQTDSRERRGFMAQVLPEPPRRSVSP